MQISSDAKLNMAEGAHKDFPGLYPNIPEGSVRHGHGQVPHGGAPPPPPRPPVSLEQLLATQNDLMRRLVGPNASNLDAERGILHTRTFWQLTRQTLLMRPTP
jgi:hypothetical protein